MTFDAYRGGRVHVRRERCATCIFRPGNLMHLSPGRLRGIVQEAREADSAIICHATLPAMGGTHQAVCRGFYDEVDTTPLQVARRLGLVEEDD